MCTLPHTHSHTATRLTPLTPSSNRHLNRFDANYWAIHQEDPTPLLTDEEKQGYDLLEVLTVELESLRFTQRRNGSLPTADTTRLQLLSETLIPEQLKELEGKRLQSILQYISDSTSLQKRAAFRMDRAKRHRKKSVDAESAAMRELQRIATQDQKKAGSRAHNYVQYRMFRVRRKQLELSMAELKVTIHDALAAREAKSPDAPSDEDLQSLQGLKAELEAASKALVEPQKRARVASAAPRDKLEGRVRGGYLGKRAPQKRAKSAAVPSREERFADLEPDQIRRIEMTQALFRFLLGRRGDEIAPAFMLQVIQLLTQLTGLPSGAVVREDLPRELGLDPGRLAITTAHWAGRQDVDLVALFLHHRQHFEQLAALLVKWRRGRDEWLAGQRTEAEDEGQDEQRCALQVADRTAQEAQGGSDPGTPPRGCHTTNPGEQRLHHIMTVFNASEQTRSDIVRALDSLSDALLGYEQCLSQRVQAQAAKIVSELKEMLSKEDESDSDQNSVSG